MPNKVAYTFVAADKFSKVAQRVSKRTDDLSSKMAEFRTEAAQASGAVNRLVGGIRKAGFGLLATGAALGAAQIPFLKQFAELEQIQVAFEQIVGSVEKGRAVFKDLQKFQTGTPFDLVSIKTAAQTLLTFGTGTEDLRIELTALGNIAAASGGRIEDLANVFGKAQLTGRVTMDVINSLAIRGAEVMKVWAEKTGKSVNQIRKVVSTGQIPFTALRETILDLGAREGGKFFGIMEEQAKRLTGTWIRFGSAMIIFKGVLGGIFSKFGKIPELLDFLARAVTRLTEIMVKFSEEHPILTTLMVRLGTVFLVLGSLVVAFSVALQGLALIALPLIIVKFLGFKAVMSAIMLLLPGLKLLIVGVTFLFGALTTASIAVVGALVLIPVALFLIIRYFDEIKTFFRAAFKVISGGIDRIVLAVGRLSVAGKVMLYFFGGFAAAAFTFLAAIVAVPAALILVIKYFDGIMAFFKSVGTYLANIFGVISAWIGKIVGLIGKIPGLTTVAGFLLGEGQVNLSGGSGEILSRNSAVVDVNLNAPKGIIQSVKSRTTGDKDGLDLGVNMAEAT